MAKYLAIDLEPQGLFVVAGECRGGTATVERAFAWVPGDDHGPPALSASTAAALGEQLRDRLKTAGMAAAPVLVSVGRDRVIFKELRYPPVPPAEEAAVVRFQALKEITENPDEVILDYAPFPSNAPTGERRATAVVMRKDLFAAIQAMCAAAGLKLAAVSPRPFAVAAGLTRAVASGAAAALANPTDAVAAVTLGPQGGEFTIVRDGHVAFTRAVSTPAVETETLLRSEIRRNLTVYGGQSTTQPVRAVYLAEVEDRLGGWATRLGDGLTVPVRTFDPLAGAAAAVAEELRGRFAGAVGLLAGRARDALPINFAAPRQPQVRADPRRKQLIGAGVAAALVLAAGAAFGVMKLSDANTRLAALQAEKTSLEDQLATQEPDRKRLEAADQWAAREVNYLDELFDMSDRLPAGDQLRVRSLTGSALPVDKAGKQEAQARFELKVGTKNADAAASLVSSIDRDNVGGKKFYVGTQKTTGGLDSAAGGAHNQLFTIITKVNHRSPVDYSDSPAFTPPPRRGAVQLPPADDGE